MKNSQKFWITIGAIALGVYNYFWYWYELKHWYHHKKDYTMTVTFSAGTIDFIVLIWIATTFIPKFNKWLDK